MKTPPAPAAAANVAETSESQAEFEAEYTLEAAVRCSHCKATIQKICVVRMLRTKVNFTSSLPRRGTIAICPSCRSMIPANVTAWMN